MAGFVIHHIAGCEFLKKLELLGLEVSDNDKKNFLRGNLIVDSSRIKTPNIGKPNSINIDLVNEEYERLNTNDGNYTNDIELRYKYLKKYYGNLVQKEKIDTHFRDINRLGKCIEYPDIDSFISIYKDLINSGDYTVLGYLYHLYTDYVYFNELLSKATIFYDENMNITEDANKVKYVYLPKVNITVPISEVYVKRGEYSIYEDYTTMNKILLDKFNIDIPVEELLDTNNLFVNPGIKEVDYSEINNVVNKTISYVAESYALTSTNLNVFNSEDVESFIATMPEKFIRMVANKELNIEKRK